MKNCKVIPVEERLTQHRLLWAEVAINKRQKKRVWNRREKKIKDWKLAKGSKYVRDENEAYKVKEEEFWTGGEVINSNFILFTKTDK